MKQALLYTLRFWVATIFVVLTAGRQLLIIKAHSGAMSYAQSYKAAKDAVMFTLPFYGAFLIAVLLIATLDKSRTLKRVLRAFAALVVFTIAFWIATLKVGVDYRNGEYLLLSSILCLSFLFITLCYKLEPEVENESNSEEASPSEG